jgi:hypothetical protein
MLKTRDENWNQRFKDEVKTHPDKDRIHDSINSLVGARNEFAHGGNPRVTLGDAYDYYVESKKMIVILDCVVS